MNKTSAKKLTRIICELLSVSKKEIKNELSIKHLDSWDSLMHMELIVTIEEEFGIKLSTKEIVSMVNIGEIKRVLKKKKVDI